MTVDQKAIFLHIQCLNKRLKQTVKFLLNYFFTYIFWSHFEIMLNVARSKKVKIISTLIKKYISGALVIHLKVQTFTFTIIIMISDCYVPFSPSHKILSKFYFLCKRHWTNTVCKYGNLLAVYCRN